MDRPTTLFSVTVPLGPEDLPQTAHSITEVALETGRSYAAIKAALREGRLPALDYEPPVRRSRPARSYVAATREQLTSWRVRSVEEALRDRPDLPQEAQEWVRPSEAAHRLGLANGTVYRRIRRRDVRQLTWDASSPFREQVRYWLPDLE